MCILFLFKNYQLTENIVRYGDKYRRHNLCNPEINMKRVHQKCHQSYFEQQSGCNSGTKEFNAFP